MARKKGHPAPKHNGEVALTEEEAERYRQVLYLKRQGWTFERIAEHVGYANRSSAKAAYDAALRRWGSEAVDDVRVTEGERLEDLWEKIWTALEKVADDPKNDPNHLATLTNSAIRVSGARRQLFGLDAPRQVEISGPEGGPLRTDMGDILRERLRKLEA